jgi:hypothetical protein
MLQTCDVWFCVEKEGRRALDVGCCTQYGSQHGHNIVATWSQHGVRGKKDSRCWMLHVTAFATFLQYVRNTLATFTQWTLDLTADDRASQDLTDANLSDASARIRRPGASSSVKQTSKLARANSATRFDK